MPPTIPQGENATTAGKRKGRTVETEPTTGRVIRSYRQAVESKYSPNSGRIRVTSYGGGAKYYARNYALDIAENHAEAIRQYIDHMQWDGTYSIGATGTGYVAVWVGE